MPTIDQYLPDHPFFTGLDAATTDLLAGCAMNVHVRAGEFLFREGEAADHFYVLRHGRIAIEVRTPARGVVLDTVDDGDVVGWSWMVPPYRWAVDACATESTSAVALDATCLLARFEEDPRVGYQMLQRVMSAMADRLYSARIRLLDLYGTPGAR